MKKATLLVETQITDVVFFMVDLIFKSFLSKNSCFELDLDMLTGPTDNFVRFNTDFLQFIQKNFFKGSDINFHTHKNPKVSK